MLLSRINSPLRPDEVIRGRKRERTEVFDEGYSRNKRMLQEGIRSLSLGDVTSTPSKKVEPGYNVFKVHACPAHGVFRMMEVNNDCNCPPSQQPLPLLQATQQGSESVSIDVLTPQLYQTQSTDEANAMETGELSDYDSIEESSQHQEQAEIFTSMVNSGKRKYVRKVDYLVDELIRKTRKTRELPQYLQDMDAGIPSFVGPSPKTDNALSIMVPFSTEFCSLSRQQNAEANAIILPAHVEEEAKLLSSSPPPILLSGEITHSEWCIEENADYRSTGDVDMDDDMFGPSQYTGSNAAIDYAKESDISDGNESDMACCDEISKQYSSNGSLDSGDSGMMLDSDDDDPFSNLDISRQSPWNGGISAGDAWMMRPSGSVGGGSLVSSAAGQDQDHDHYQDDENSEDVINVGTF